MHLSSGLKFEAAAIQQHILFHCTIELRKPLRILLSATYWVYSSACVFLMKHIFSCTVHWQELCWTWVRCNEGSPFVNRIILKVHRSFIGTRDYNHFTGSLVSSRGYHYELLKTGRKEVVGNEKYEIFYTSYHSISDCPVQLHTRLTLVLQRNNEKCGELTATSRLMWITLIFIKWSSLHSTLQLHHELFVFRAVINS